MEFYGIFLQREGFEAFKKCQNFFYQNPKMTEMGEDEKNFFDDKKKKKFRQNFFFKNSTKIEKKLNKEKFRKSFL